MKLMTERAGAGLNDLAPYIYNITYQCYGAVDHTEQPHGTQIANCNEHDSVLSSLEDESLHDCQNGD